MRNIFSQFSKKCHFVIGERYTVVLTSNSDLSYTVYSRTGRLLGTDGFQSHNNFYEKQKTRKFEILISRKPEGIFEILFFCFVRL